MSGSPPISKLPQPSPLVTEEQQLWVDVWAPRSISEAALSHPAGKTHFSLLYSQLVTTAEGWKCKIWSFILWLIAFFNIMDHLPGVCPSSTPLFFFTSLINKITRYLHSTTSTFGEPNWSQFKWKMINDNNYYRMSRYMESGTVSYVTCNRYLLNQLRSDFPFVLSPTLWFPWCPAECQAAWIGLDTWTRYWMTLLSGWLMVSDSSETTRGRWVFKWAYP